MRKKRSQYFTFAACSSLSLKKFFQRMRHVRLQPNVTLKSLTLLLFLLLCCCCLLFVVITIVFTIILLLLSLFIKNPYFFRRRRDIRVQAICKRLKHPFPS